MQPIKTTNAMNPAPAKGIESFPTPVIDDVVIAEVVNAWKGDYQPLEYGTLWKDVSHAPNQGSFPEHKLVYQQPTSEDGQWIKRIWVNDRVNQDSYNYAIKYSAGSQDHPIYIRTYVVPREGYAPLPDGTPDPLFPTAVLVDEEATRIEGELDSRYITVTRVYETLPGPQVPTKRYNERGDLETVLVQTVPPNTPPDPDGLLVTQSQVVQEEMGKGVKTTATVQDHALLQIKENKEGLLGETITTDDIVDPSTNPDTLSQTVVSSVVEQFSATKARKRTTTASGPTSLSQKNNDGKLLGDITSTQSIVAPATSPDAVSSSILSSEVKQIDSGKAVKTNIVLNSTPTLSGNQNEEGLLGNKSVVETIVAAGTSADSLSTTVLSSSVEAIDSVRSKKTTITSTGPTSLTQKSNDGKLIGDITVTESVVPPTDNPDAITTSIFSSEVKQVDSGKAIKKNTVINSTPTLTSKRKSGGLMGNTRTVETVVSAGTEADAINTVIVESIVEPINSSISRKATTSQEGPTSLVGGAFKEGLLGETVITESIVTASSNPDALSQTVVSSTIEPIDSAKSKKTTITSTGPTSLTQKSKDGKLLGDITSTESIVAPDTNPDAVSTTILSSEIKQIDSGKAVKTNVVLNSTPTLSGNQNSEGLLGNKQVVESIVPAGTAADALSQTILSSSVESIDSIRSKKTTITSTGPATLSGNQKKEGLLGEVIVVESIVAAGTSADALSQTVISSQVDPIDSAKSKKTTTTSTGPTSLTQTSKDGKLLGDVTSTQSIVAAGTEPDAVSSSILSSEIKQIDSAKAVKTNVVLNSTPTLSGNSNEGGLLGKKTKTETIVSSGASPDALSMSVISSVVEPIDSVRSRKITVGSTGPTQLSSQSLVDTAVGQVQGNIYKEIVPIGQTINGGQFIIQDTINPIDEIKAERETVTVPEYPELTTYDLDEQLGVSIITEREIVAHNTPYPNPAPQYLISLNDRPLDKWKTLRITSKLSALPATRTEYKTQQFSFPALLDDITIDVADVGFGRYPISLTSDAYGTGINTFISVTPDLRPTLSLPTRIRIVTTFYTYQPAPDNIFNIVTQDVSYNGIMFNFNFGDVLTNGQTITVTADANDQRYSGLTESVTFQASSPSRSSYTAQIGSEKVIFSDVEYYKSNIWFKRTGYVTLV